MRTMIRRTLSVTLALAAAVAMAAVLLPAEGTPSAQEVTVTDAQPGKFGLGRFEAEDRIFLGIVLNESDVVELDAANDHLRRRSLEVGPMPMPSDMKELAYRYEDGLRSRIYQIVNHVTAAGLLDGDARPGFVHRLEDLNTLAPHRPHKILNAAVNYAAHGEEMGGEAHEKGTPYLFLKATSSIIGNGHPIVMPRSGYQWANPETIDWEVEFAVVIGKPARYASLEDAADHIFGYTVHIDVSNRGGRGDDSAMGSDWLVGKGLDTYGPLGPWIVPKEFVADHNDLDLTLTVNGETMQSSNTSFSINKPADLIYYASSLLTLEPGDVIASGTPEGVGAGRDPQVFLDEGDVVEATVEGIGSLRHTVVAPR